MGAFDAMDVGIVALSTDTEEQALGVIERFGLKFPVACELELPEDADKIGAYFSLERNCFHATQFVLDSDRKVEVSVYSTGPVGRLSVEEVLRYVAP